MLEGLIVLELGDMVAVPYCGKLLADLGATVVKLETPGRGDAARHAGPFANSADPERSALFLYLNTNKRSAELDVTTDEGRRALGRLLRGADVFVQDLSTDDLERLGLDAYPHLVVTSVTPFGRSGPRRDWVAHPLNTYHASGQTSFGYTSERDDDRAPPKGAGYLGEYDAGLVAAVGTLGAVLGGAGQHVDVSKVEALMSLERVDIGRSIELGSVDSMLPWSSLQLRPPQST